MSDIKQGDTVRLHGDEYEVLAVGDEKAFVRSREGGESSAYLSVLVKVEPTPADVWLTIDNDGNRTAHNGPGEAWAWAAGHPLFAPWRVARFTFAEWIDTEQSDG